MHPNAKLKADIDINMNKRVSQHVHKRESIAVTAEEIANAEVKYEDKCDFCLRKFKTDRAMHMHIHRASCVHNYVTTDEVFTFEKIVDVFGHKDKILPSKMGRI